jgi:hypothetical protein
MAVGLFLRSVINMGTGMLIRRSIAKTKQAEFGSIVFQPMPFRAGLRDLDVYGHMNNGRLLPPPPCQLAWLLLCGVGVAAWRRAGSCGRSGLIANSCLRPSGRDG